MNYQKGYPQQLVPSPEGIDPGALIVARAWKYDGAPHWVVPGLYLGSDEYGHWVHQPAGALVARPGTAHLAASDALCLVPHSGLWVATLYSDADEDFDVYIDLSMSIGWQQMKRGAWEVNSIDMDLDVVRSRSRGVYLDDEDEFIEHAALLGYPAALQQQLREASEWLLEQAGADAAPFNYDHRNRWLAAAAALKTTTNH